LDPRLGKVPNISAAALLPNGSPILIIDVDDLLRNIENLTAGHRLSEINPSADAEIGETRKRILVIDDSLTVRELERKLLGNRGYIVDVAVDGLDGWNAVRTGHYDLVLTDVDMPRLDGVELLKLIRKDSRLKSLPVMIVSYKDREEDRQRGLEAGADYYLTKGSFHDETLVRAVSDLIGGTNS
jgi:two-component system sensor histidine kinase and response regulator WspE